MFTMKYEENEPGTRRPEQLSVKDECVFDIYDFSTVGSFVGVFILIVLTIVNCGTMYDMKHALEQIEMRLDAQEMQAEIQKRQAEMQTMFDAAVKQWEARKNGKESVAHD